MVAGALGEGLGHAVGIGAQGEGLLWGWGAGDGILVPIRGDVFPIGVGGDGGFAVGFGHGFEAMRGRMDFASVTHGLHLGCRVVRHCGGMHHGEPSRGRCPRRADSGRVKTGAVRSPRGNSIAILFASLAIS